MDASLSGSTDFLFKTTKDIFMTITTQDCKVFISNLISKNTSIVISIYGTQYAQENQKDLVSHATDPKKWKRSYKCKPGGGNYEFEDYQIFTPETHIDRMGYQSLKTMPKSDFVSERGFYLDPDHYDTGVGFVVLEHKNGDLYLGDYIGD
jgi:hypothetical protein